MTFDEVLSKFRIERRSQDGAQCICPAHQDKVASLTISKGKKGTLLYCHAGCNTEQILKSVGLKMSDLFEGSYGRSNERWREYVENREQRQIEDVYNYVDLSGRYAYTRLRLTGKKFLYGIIENDWFRYGLQGTSRKGIPAVYCNGLNKLKRAVSDGIRVFYAEGEKDVNTLMAHGLIGVTCGASGDWNAACAKLFEGADVVVLADNDKAGKSSANAIKEDLRKIAKSVKIVVPTPDIDKGDISDFFKYHSVEDLEKLIETTNTKTMIRALSMNEVKEEQIDWLIPNLNNSNSCPLSSRVKFSIRFGFLLSRGSPRVFFGMKKRIDNYVWFWAKE